MFIDGATTEKAKHGGLIFQQMFTLQIISGRENQKYLLEHSQRIDESSSELMIR